MSSPAASHSIWVGHFPPNVSLDAVYDEMSLYRPKKAQYDPVTCSIELWFSDEAGASLAFHALNGRNLFGRVLAAYPLSVPYQGSHAASPPPPAFPVMPAFSTAIGAHILSLLAERPDFFGAVNVALNGLGLPSPFFSKASVDTTPPIEGHPSPTEPATGPRVKRTGSDLSPENPPHKSPKLAESYDPEDSDEHTEQDQPLHLPLTTTLMNKAAPQTLTLRLELGASNPTHSVTPPLQVIPFSPQLVQDPQSTVPAPIARVSKEQLASNRLTPEQIRGLPRFEDWDPGTPSLKLFVKNLAPKVTEADLLFIFARFSKDDEARDVQIRLMTRGKLHGQAFVTMPEVSAAQEAISEVSGYVLHDRPMILEYGKVK